MAENGTRIAIIGGICAVVAAIIGAGATILSSNGQSPSAGTPLPETTIPSDDLKPPTSTEVPKSDWRFEQLTGLISPDEPVTLDSDDDRPDFTWDPESGFLKLIGEAFLVGGVPMDKEPQVQTCIDSANGQRLPWAALYETGQYICIYTSSGALKLFHVIQMAPLSLDVYVQGNQ